MSGKEEDYIDNMETSLDEVEIDEQGNIRKISQTPSPDDLDEMETDLDAVEIDALDVDEDGNLRIHSAEKLLNETSSERNSQAGVGSIEDLSARERRSLEKTQATKRQYLREGTTAEEKRMLAVECGDTDETGGSAGYRDGATLQGHDLHDIELSVFRPNEQGAASETHPQSQRTDLDFVESGTTDSSHRRSDLKWYERLLEIFSDFFKNMSTKRLAILIAVIAVGIGVAMLCTLLPASFVYVEYYELALTKNKVTGTVNREDVYYPGCYLLTPQTTLVRFNGTAHTVRQTLEVLTSDQLAFNLGFSLQYFIKPEELGTLFTNYMFDYEEVLDAVIKSTVKNEATKYSLDNFRLNRTVVENDFRKALAFKLSGNCCPTCCPNKCQGKVDCRTCRLAGRCYQGFHMDMRYFQMGVVDIPAEVAERFLKQTILLIAAEKEMFVQEHAVESKKSEELQKDILNKAAEIREAANAEADEIRAVAEADYEKTVQTSYKTALNKLYGRLNITQQDHKLSLMYIRALEDMSDNLYNLNFGKLTAFDSEG